MTPGNPDTEEAPAQTARRRITITRADYLDGRRDGLSLLSELRDITSSLTSDGTQVEGFLRSIDEVTFFGPVYAGEVIDLEARVVEHHDKYRVIEVELAKVAARVPSDELNAEPAGAMALPMPVIVCRFRATFVLPRYDSVASLPATFETGDAAGYAGDELDELPKW